MITSRHPSKWKCKSTCTNVDAMDEIFGMICVSVCTYAACETNTTFISTAIAIDACNDIYCWATITTTLYLGMLRTAFGIVKHKHTTSSRCSLFVCRVEALRLMFENVYNWRLRATSWFICGSLCICVKIMMIIYSCIARIRLAISSVHE